MKKFFIYSLLIHAIPFLFTLNFNPEVNQTTEVGMSGGEYNVIPVEITTEGDGDGQLKNYYWGIGISTRQMYDTNRKQWIIKVNQVYLGYSADFSGILMGDIIIAINKAEVSNQNDIKGDGPATLRLTIDRQGVIIEKIIQRVKVYY